MHIRFRRVECKISREGEDIQETKNFEVYIIQEHVLFRVYKLSIQKF